MGATEWTILIGVIGLAVTTVGVISTILTGQKGAARFVLFGLLGVIGMFAMGAVIVGAALTFGKASWPTPTPTPTPIPGPTSARTVTSAPTPTPTVFPTPTSSASNTPTPQPSTLPQPTPQADDIRMRPSPTKVINNDIGETKTNKFYEITIENARSTTDQFWQDGCRVRVPPSQKAVVVRVSIRWLPYKTLTANEMFDMGAVKPTDFVIVDESNRRIDPACQNFPIFVGENANTKELVYLVRLDSAQLRFSFQRAGTGNPISFDLSGLN